MAERNTVEKMQFAVSDSHSGFRRVPSLTVRRVCEYGGPRLLAEYLTLWSKAKLHTSPGFRVDHVEVTPEVVTLYECLMLDRPNAKRNYWVIYKTVPTDRPLRRVRLWERWNEELSCPAQAASFSS